MKNILIVLSVFVLILVGCSAAPTPDPEPAPRETEQSAPEEGMIVINATPTEGVVFPTDEAPISDVPQVLIVKAKEDLARYLGMDMSEITLISANAVDWPDSSLGCPEPDTMYAQVITPGYRILLAVDGLTYSYHGDKSTQLFWCDPENTREIFIAP